MKNREKQPEQPSRPSQPQQSAPAAESPSPAASSPAASAGGRNVLSSDVDIKGKVKFSNDLIVDGKIEGEIVSDGSLTVGENAQITALIKTRSVVIHGKVFGNIHVSDRVELKQGAELVGDIIAGTLSIESGAIFVGKSQVGTPSIKPPVKQQPLSGDSSKKTNLVAAS